MDKILIRDLKIFAYHGVNEEEKVNGQNFIFDIDLSVNMIKAFQALSPYQCKAQQARRLPYKRP